LENFNGVLSSSGSINGYASISIISALSSLRGALDLLQIELDK